MNEQRLTWDDLRTVSAIVRGGSLVAAARAVNVSHATVFRRLGDIEARLGVKLFARARTGYVPTPAGEELAAAAAELETGIVATERRLMDRDLRPGGRLRVATTDTLLMGLLTPIFRRFRAAFPAIELDVIVSNEMANLTRRDAEVAIRPSLQPPETLVGRRVSAIGMAIYAHRDHPAAKAETPDLATYDWIGPDESLSNLALTPWMKRRGLAERAQFCTNTLLGLREAVECRLGIGVLPCFLGDPKRSLVRLGKPVPELEGELWLLTHPDLRAVVRVRAFLDFMGDALAAERGLLEGKVALSRGVRLPVRSRRGRVPG